MKDAQRPKALRDVKASLLVDKIAEREAIAPTNDEVDAEVQRIAKQQREPVAAVRKKLQKDGVLSRIAYQIRSNKTLNFLFEHARKEAGEPEPRGRSSRRASSVHRVHIRVAIPKKFPSTCWR